MSAADLVAAFWRLFRATGRVDDAAVRELAALACGDTAEAEAATAALFGEIVEPLGDAFGADEARAYGRVFAAVVAVARRQTGAGDLDAALTGAGLTDPDVAARAQRLAESQPAPVGTATRFVVLSRVTLGADVAIGTPIMAALLESSPAARVVFVGPAPAAGLLAGNPRISARPIAYPRRGDLLSRLRTWQAVRSAVGEEVAGLAPEEYLVVDPDSRLTQLGLLPVAPDERTRFFPSRTFTAPGAERLGELAGRWAQRLCRTDRPPLPRVWLTDEARAWAAALRGALSRHADRWVVVNLGTGGNPRKGLGALFEEGLLRALIGRGLGVLLARGTTEAEARAAHELADRLAADGADVRHLPAGGEPSALLDAPGRGQLVTWQEDSARMAALVAAADLHVGYDSAGQHVAAAVGTPGLTVFVPAGGERHMRRWSPWGPGATRVVRVAPGADDPAAAVGAAVDGALALLEGRPG